MQKASLINLEFREGQNVMVNKVLITRSSLLQTKHYYSDMFCIIKIHFRFKGITQKYHSKNTLNAKGHRKVRKFHGFVDD